MAGMCIIVKLDAIIVNASCYNVMKKNSFLSSGGLEEREKQGEREGS